MGDRPLIERLRGAAHYGRGSTSQLLDEAADEIERLQTLARCPHVHAFAHYGKHTGIPVCVCGALQLDGSDPDFPAGWYTLP